MRRILTWWPWLPWLSRTLGFVTVVSVIGLGAGGWYYSDQLLPAPVPGPVQRDVEVVASDEAAGTITLAATDGDLAELPTVGLVGEDGTVLLDGPRSRSGDGIKRRGTAIIGDWPDPGDLVGAEVHGFPGDPATSLGRPFETVDIPGDGGVLPAWRVVPNGAETDTWVVLVHGRGAALSESNRVLPVLKELGLPSLTISVRNDPNAPADPDGYGYYGDREWEDLQAAVSHLVSTEDAERIVLVGYSQGASIALCFLRRATEADLVEAGVLVSPLISLEETLVLQARNRDIPEPVIPPLVLATRFITTWRSGLDFDQVDHLERIDELPSDVPLLVTHGAEDQTIPVEPTRALARARPEQIVYIEYPGADHVREWNVDRVRFEADLRAFLAAEVGAAGP